MRLFSIKWTQKTIVQIELNHVCHASSVQHSFPYQYSLERIFSRHRSLARRHADRRTGWLWREKASRHEHSGWKVITREREKVSLANWFPIISARHFDSDNRICFLSLFALIRPSVWLNWHVRESEDSIRVSWSLGKVSSLFTLHCETTSTMTEIGHTDRVTIDSFLSPSNPMINKKRWQLKVRWTRLRLPRERKTAHFFTPMIENKCWLTRSTRPSFIPRVQTDKRVLSLFNQISRVDSEETPSSSLVLTDDHRNRAIDTHSDRITGSVSQSLITNKSEDDE